MSGNTSRMVTCPSSIRKGPGSHVWSKDTHLLVIAEAPGSTGVAHLRPTPSSSWYIQGSFPELVTSTDSDMMNSVHKAALAVSALPYNQQLHTA